MHSRQQRAKPENTNTILPPSSPVEEREQILVNSLFDKQSSYWTNIYQDKDVFGVIYQQRRDIALSYVDALSIPKESRILEIGCGAGLTTLRLAKRGYTIEAMDSVPAMLELTRNHALDAGVGHLVHEAIGDVHELSYESNSFDLIVAMGVTPWLHNLKQGLQEMVRVLKPGGHIILSADNRYRLVYLLDPALIPALKPVRESLKKILEMLRLRKPSNDARPHMYSVSEFNESLQRAGLEIQTNMILGYGPFTLMNRKILPDSLGVKLHQKLQKRAIIGSAILRSTGSQYVVLAQKNDKTITL